MPRKNRVHYRFSFHHVMLRGNNRKNIFYEENDYQSFIKIISEAADIYGFKIHLYCLMTNHIHLVVEVRDIPISRIMQGIAGRYAKIHNVKYKKIGHLFQGRFKSKLVSNDEYLLELCFYIHMNPIKAKMCQLLDEYPWSSHDAYKTKSETSWLSTCYIAGIIAGRLGSGSSYISYMQQRESKSVESIFCEFDDSGELTIVNSVAQHTQYKPCLSLENIPLVKLVTIICSHMQVNPDEIDSPSLARRVSLARSMIAYYAHYHGKYTFEDVACLMGRQSKSISKTLRGHLVLANVDQRVRGLMESLERLLSITDVDGLIV